MPEGNLNVGKDGRFTYGRIGFDSAGQDSYQSPPAQNEDAFELLENVLPPTDGSFQRRWGYELFNNPALTARRMYEFQDDDGTRAIVLTATTGVESLTEAGAAHNTAIFTPTSPPRPPRMAMSRGYGYFADGVAADLKKWDGSTTGGTTKWGITSPAGTTTATALTNGGTFANVDTGGPAWATPGNAAASDNVDTTTQLNSGTLPDTDYLKVTNFGFAIPTNATIISVQVNVEQEILVTGAASARFYALLSVGGVVHSYFDNMPISITGNVTPDTVTSHVKTLNGAITPADVNSSGFGVFILYSALNGSTYDLNIDHVQMLVTYSVPALTVGATVAGNITLVSGRKYFTVFENPLTGHLSALSPSSLSTGPITTDNVPLSNIPVSTDAQVTTKHILATADGGDETLLYDLVTLANATTTYTDSTTEADLLTHNIYVEVDDFGFEQGLAENDPPPNGDFPTPHRGRIYMLVDELLYFSKSIDELTTSTGVIAGRWEEAWPGDYFLDISAGAETGRGLLSDGQVLYIGTERRIIRLFGDGPQTFSKPETTFNDVGILNQQVWQPVFREGQAIGAMWLTPDMRLVISDMNSYRLVGSPVQDILDSVNTAVAEDVAWAAYHGQGQYNFYILAVPTGVNTEPDTLLIYDLTQNRFVVWRLLDKVTAGLNNVTASGVTQFLFGTSTGKVYNFDEDAVQDRVGDTPANFTATMRTSFLHFGNPLARKTLNWLQVLTGDSGLLVSVAGASTKAEFDSPSAVVTDAAIAANPLGDYHVPLAGDTAKDRSYRVQFKSTGQAVDLLSGWFAEGHYIHFH